MHRLLISNIRKSIKIIAEGNPTIPEQMITTIDSEKSEIPSIVHKIARIAARPVPYFYWDSAHELQSPQKSFFGFYALKNAIRGVLLGSHFMQAGDLLLKSDFCAASISLFYTAAFHLIYSFLSLNGRVIIDQIQGLPKVIRYKKAEVQTSQTLDPSVEVAIGILMKNNEWKFEPRKRTHQKRWEELRHILLKRGYQVPDFFMCFFKYILFYENTLPERDLIIRGIHRLVDVRHESLYHGYGYDDIAHDALMNREFGIAPNLKLKAQEYHNFAMGLLKSTVSEVSEFVPKLSARHVDEVSTLLLVSVYTPPFEIGNLAFEGEEMIDNKIKHLFEWLWSAAVKNEKS